MRDAIGRELIERSGAGAGRARAALPRRGAGRDMTVAWGHAGPVRVLAVTEREGVPPFLNELALYGRYRPLGPVTSVPAATAAVAEHAPDVVLAVVGSSARADELAELSRRVATVVVSTLPPEAALLRCMAGGARGFVWMPVEPGLLEHAVAVVAAGHTYVDPRSAEWLVDSAVQHHVAKVEHGLTVRQSQVLQLVRTGLTNKGIAEVLGVSSDTVKRHLQEAMRKLGVHDRRDAAARAEVRFERPAAVPAAVDGGRR